MNKAKNVIEFYVLCNRLKDLVRTGWKTWNVDRARIESVAEHIYGVQMLAIAMWSEYRYEIDIAKVITMLAVHEVEEILIGDITIFQLNKEEKKQIGQDAVIKVFKKLSNADKIKSLIFEFDDKKTKEAQFAYYCDKLECGIQCKLYDEQNCVDLTRQDNNESANNREVKSMLQSGLSWSEMWLRFHEHKDNYDKNFSEVSNFVINNKISEE